jgi:hypothetical protein
MGGKGADEITLTVLEEVLARRRGVAPGRRAATRMSWRYWSIGPGTSVGGAVRARRAA